MASAGSGRVAGKVALVTGGTRGMGPVHARLLAENGARVVLGYRGKDQGEKVVASLRADGLDVTGVLLDVTSAEHWQAAVGSIEQSHGKLDILVNNAGALSPASLLDCSLDDWNRAIAVNQTSVFLGMKCAAPAMQRAGAGSIVNVSSVLATLGTEFGIAYHASKGAIRMLTRAAAVALGPTIRVNSVIPAIIETDMAVALGADRVRERVATYPMGRAGQPIEVAQVVLFLASDEASYVTGAEYTVDGGALAGIKRPAPAKAG